MKKYLVIGNPITHSLSPELHNFWIKENGINGIYNKKKLNVEDLREFFLKIKNKEINGANITVPFKRDVIAYLDQLSLEAEKTQSVNTIYLNNNKIIGHNTDISGFELAIKKTKFDVSNKKIGFSSDFNEVTIYYGDKKKEKLSYKKKSEISDEVVDRIINQLN